MLLGIVMTAAMSGLLSACAPNVGQRTMAGVISYESGWKPWSVGDNTAKRSYVYGNQAQAISKARELLDLGHDIDTGLAQINSSNFRGYGLTPENVFDPCTNVKIGADILAGAYRGAYRRNWIGRPIRNTSDLYMQQQYALVHALSAYNSGGYWASMKYAGNVYDIALGVREGFSRVEEPQVRSVVASEPTIRTMAQKIIVTHKTTPSAASILVNGTTENWSTRNP